ncbi:MAG: pyridoxal-phosphate dependent enzyme [Halobacteria archaeon]|nr:pyridoxal-phosphate dependent enzyme [Halobacteria archaeon]
MKLVCFECGKEHAGKQTECECGGALDPRYPSEERPVPDNEVSMGEGNTPLVESSVLDVADFHIKDESRNPTGSLRDREMSLAVSMVRDEANKVALYSTGDAGISAAAYAARAGLVFVPNRASFDAKAMINVHGGDMTVVRGRLDEARERAEEGEGTSLSPFETPYRHEGAATVGEEILASLEDVTNLHIVCPIGNGTLFVGLHKALPSEIGLHGVQAEGCAPIVRAYETGDYQPWDSPDTVIGAVEVPDPAGASVVLSALDERKENSEVVAIEDGDALDTALELAADGIEVSPAGALAAAGAVELDSIDPEDTVVAVNPGSARASADVLRNRLVYHGE